MFRLIALYIPHTLLVAEGKVIIQAQIRGECELVIMHRARGD